MAKLVLFLLCSVLACIAGQRITTIQLDGVQYFISRMNPYSPELNYFLAYQYCRSLGLQLASFETKEKVESMTTYLQNAGYSKYDFWTSGNRLGTGMFLWMSTGLPFNATFDYFENSADAVQAGLLDPVDHNSNTSPQRTARDSSSGLEKGCVILKPPSLKWSPEDCSAVKDFICEQTRCYYYNYGSIPVSSAQGRPITSTTTTHAPIIFSTTPLPHLFTSTFATLAKKSEENLQDISEPSLESLRLAHEEHLGDQPHEEQHHDVPAINKSTTIENNDDVDDDDDDEDIDEPISAHHKNDDDVVDDAEDQLHISELESSDDSHHHHHDNGLPVEDTEHEEGRSFSNDENKQIEEVQRVEEETSSEPAPIKKPEIEDEEKEEEKLSEQEQEPAKQKLESDTVNSTPSVEQRLKQISQEIEKFGTSPENVESDIGHQSFLSLSDLIRTLRPNDKKIPQIDSDYSNTMRVLGETSSIVSSSSISNNNNNNSEDTKKLKDTESNQEVNRALF